MYTISKKALLFSLIFVIVEIILVFLVKYYFPDSLFGFSNIPQLCYIITVTFLFSENKGNILKCLLFSFFNSIFTTALMFKLLHFPGTIVLIITSAVLCLLSFLITYMRFKRTNSPFYRNLLSLAALNTTFVIIMLFAHFLKL